MKYRVSKQRDQIMAYMNELNAHVSAEQIYEDLKQKEVPISLATIYRNLNILVDMHKIKKIILPHGIVYDKTIMPHHHFYCIKCKELYDLAMKYDENLVQCDDAIVGCTKSYEITVKGICSRCM